jgi:hypothetical protein
MDLRLQYVRQILLRLTFHLQFSIPFEGLSSNVANSVQDFSAGKKYSAPEEKQKNAELHRKKSFSIFPSPAGMSLTKLSSGEFGN